MSEGFIIDWTIVAALFATSAALIATAITHIASRSRNNLESRFEICRYREKWLSELKEEVAIFVSNTMLLVLEEKKDKPLVKEIMTRRIRILLAVPSSNQHYDELQKYLDEITSNMMEVRSSELGSNTGSLTRILKIILDDEWNEIRSLLYKKEKYNAKNK